MKRKANKRLAILLTLVMLLELIPSMSVTAQADGGSVASIGTIEYTTLEAAFEAVTDDTATTITLLEDCSGNGIIVPSERNITVDFKGYTYTVTGPTLAGSGSTKNQCFQLLKDSTITFKNGAIVADNAAVKMIIQNYADLTLDNMTLDATRGTNNMTYVMSTNNGSTTIQDTVITAKSGSVAFDACSGWGGYASNDVTVTGDSVITGNVEVSYWGQTNTGGPTLNLDDGVLSGNIAITKGGEYTTVTKAEDFAAAAPTGYEWNGSTLIATAAPGTSTDYELYYTLDRDIDTNDNGYHEYDVGDTVTASLYLKNKTAEDQTLQAFDLYLTNSARLTDVSFTPVAENQAEVIDANSNGVKLQIQSIGKSVGNKIEVPLPAGEAVLLGTLTYTISDAAACGKPLPITISGKSNIALAGTPQSFIPSIGRTVKGVEVATAYTVTYVSNLYGNGENNEGVGNMPADQTKRYNMPLPLSENEPISANKDFLGWARNQYATEVEYPVGGTLPANINENVTLYGVWNIKTYTVTWKDWNGSQLEQDIGCPHGAFPIYDGGTPTKAQDAQYSYEFRGWSLTNDYDYSTNSALVDLNTYPITEDTTFYAVYSKTTRTYTVIWKNWNGDVLETDENVPYGATPSYDRSNPYRSADNYNTYTFDGWSPAISSVKGDTTYTAQYTSANRTYTLTFELGDHAVSGQTAPAPVTEKEYGYHIPHLPAGPVAEVGYKFVGWGYVKGGIQTIYADAYTMYRSETLIAQYEEVTYNVVYNANGGAGSLPANHDNVSYNTFITIGSGSGLSKTGYQFAGWNTQADGSGTDYSAEANVNKLTTSDGATITLYAKWTSDAYTITYNYDGGVTTVNNPTSYNVENLPITLTRPTKTGYDFNSWTIAVKENESGYVVVDGDTLQTNTWGNLTVRANWTPAMVNYTVKHFQQNLDNDNYTEVAADAQIMIGMTGEQTMAAANTYTGFTAQSFTQATIAGDGSTVVSIYYNRNTHTVTYQYTGTVPTGAPAVPAQATYQYGATVYVSQTEVNVPHYTFSGWQKDGLAAPNTFTMSDADVTITGSFTEKNYTIKFWTLESGAGSNTTLSEQTYTESTQNGITVPAVPAKEWYDANGWTAYELFSAAVIDAYPQYTKHVYTITFQDEDGHDLVNQGADYSFDVDDKTITPPAVPEKPGYNGAWPAFPTDTPSDAPVRPVYTAVEYTITFEVNGGTAIADMLYTIESTDVLPSATGKNNFVFQGWKVTQMGTETNWALNSVINGGTELTGRYGNVTLTAQWDNSLAYELEEYKYADTGWRMLRIDASNLEEGQVYKFGNETMYYTTDSDYQITVGQSVSTAVFYTLIETSSDTLTDEQIKSVTIVAAERQTINYNGDVNGDNAVNIADANTVFQMLAQTTMGGYYSNQLTVAQRLAADMAKNKANADHRGSLEDVNAIVAIINNDANH